MARGGTPSSNRVGRNGRAGTIWTAVNASLGDPCVNSFQDQPGQTTCKSYQTCSPGSYASVVATASNDRTCTTCGFGTVQPPAHIPSCEACTRGRQAEHGQPLGSLADVAPAWLAGLQASGQARLLADTAQQRLVLSQAFAWPAEPGELRGQRQGAVLRPLDLAPTLHGSGTARSE